MEKIIIESPDKQTSILVAVNFVSRKYKLISYNRVKKWLRTKYYVIVVEKIIDYPEEIKQAIQEERYEDVTKLKSEFKLSETEFYSQLEKQINSDLLKLPTLFN